MLEQIHLRGILSFKDTTLDLRPLNVVIGPNGSGKSNLIEALNILRATPSDVWGTIRAAGGFEHLVWKGSDESVRLKSVEVGVALQRLDRRYRYRLTCEGLTVAYLIGEKIEEQDSVGIWRPVVDRDAEKAKLSGCDGIQDVQREDLFEMQSILAQIKEPVQYPYLANLSSYLESVRIYRSSILGPEAPARWPQTADMENDRLREDGRNLGLVLNRLERDASLSRIEDYLSRFLKSYKRISIQVEGGTVQIFLAERDLRTLIPATRISDGTLHFLSLMAILCHPNPGTLVCIEEPEVGLHPDAVLLVAEAMKEASQRTQLIVTTHSEALVDALSDQPESIIVCERGSDGSTQFSRLSSSDLDAWLEEYSLGRLWRKGEIGANP